MRHLLALPLLLLTACASTPEATTQPVVQSERVEPDTQVLTEIAVDPVFERKQKFERWRNDFTQRALARGYSPALLARTIGQVRINEKALERDSNQPEFTRPVWSYIESAANPDRVNRGQSELVEHSETLEEIERIYGVPREILTAIWGLESSYGRILGTHDIFSSLATFAFDSFRS